ncbi:MAG: hypothetical protein U1D67_10235, partial [Dehalococcoidia bacterium]|nr:hypothetical protein [Dehalococcoidia bacterium]
SIPLDNLVKDHEETLTKLAILRALTISLKAKTDNAGDQAKHPWQTDLARINDLLTFFDNDLKVHFR